MARFAAVEAYSHEVSSCGFWPGGCHIDEPVFYAYAYAEPPDFREYPIKPEEAYFSKELNEFLLPYEAVRTAKSTDYALMAFTQSTYEAAGNLAKWVGMH